MDMPLDVLIPKGWEVKLGWNPNKSDWAVMLIVEAIPGEYMTIGLPPGESMGLGKALLEAAEKCRTEPPHPVGAKH